MIKANLQNIHIWTKRYEWKQDKIFHCASMCKVKSGHYATVMEGKIGYIRRVFLKPVLFYAQCMLISTLSLILLQTVRTFSLKGMTSKLFGQETPEQREAKLKALETQIEEGEDIVKERNTECE